MYESPIIFTERYIPTLHYHQSQKDILQSTMESDRTATFGPRGLGKTTTIAGKIIHFALTREANKIDWKVITLASSWTQLSNYLWPEVHKWANRIQLPGGIPAFTNRELNLQSINMKHGKAFCIGSDEANRIEGAHADEMLVVIDEAKGVKPDIWNALEGMDARGVNVQFMALSTPGMPIGRFYDICKGKPGYQDWKVMQVTLEMALASSMVSQGWVDRRREQWGEDSPMYSQHCKGEFAGVENNALFRSSWLEQAMELEVASGSIIQSASDIAEKGIDQTMLAAFTGNEILPLTVIHSDDLMDITGLLIAENKKYGSPRISIDADGIGAGVASRMEELEIDCHRYHGNGSPHDGETFLNIRAEAYWLVREMVKKGTLKLPDDDLLKEELLAQKLKPRSDGKIQLVPKEQIFKAIGRSPDRADAVVMAIYQLEPWISIREALR